MGFFANVPIASSVRPSIELNGTRLTAVATNTGGMEFSICSSSLVERFTEFEREMQFSFDAVVETIRLVKTKEIGPAQVTEVLRQSLRMFYYWVNFAPLTRGTSATGYAALLTGVLAIGFDIQNRLPARVQLDWEAIFSTTPDSFIDRALPWVDQCGPTKIPKDWIEGENDSLGSVESVFKTLRHVLYALQIPMPSS